MRMILAALLVDGDRILGKVEGAITQTVFHVNEDVCQLIAIRHDRLRQVVAFTRSILTHVDLLRLWSCAIKGHRPLDRSGRGRINRSRSCRRLCSRTWRGALLLVGVFFLATAYQQSQSKQAEQNHCCPDFPVHYVALSSD